MFWTLYYKMQLAFAQKANRLIFTIRKIKFLGNHISEEWYVRSDIKKVFGVLGMIFAFLGDVLGKLCYFGLIILLPNFMMLETFLDVSRKTFGGMLLWTFFFLNCMMGSFVNSHITKNGGVDENEYLLLNLMRFNPKEHYLTGILWEYGKQSLYYGVLFWIIIVGIFQSSGLSVLWLMGMYVCFRFVGEAVRLKLNDQFGIPFQEKNKIVGGMVFLYNTTMFLAAYGVYPLFFVLGGEKKEIVLPFSGNLFIPVLLLGLAVVAMVFSIKYLWGYSDYVLVARRLCNLQEFSEKQEAATSAKKASYALHDGEVNEKELQSRMYQNKKGYDYLNAIFFRRHKRLVRNAVKIKTGITGGVFGITASVLLVSQFIMPTKEFMKMSNSVWGVIGHFIPIMVFIMYCASSGQNLTRAMFFNCDISLLKYGYYRTSDAILQGFWIRLKYMVRAELPTVCAFTAGIVVNTLLLHQQRHWLQMLSIVLCVCILTVFYSMVFLCMYYIFQPFTEGGAETGVGYKVCAAGIYWISWMCLQIHTVPAYFTVVVLAVTVVVLLAGFVLAWRLAPRTFHLK